MDLSSWMLKGTLQHLASSERILFSAEYLDNQSEPWTLDPMVYYGTSDASMFWILEIRQLHVLQYSMTTPLQDISVRWRHSIKVCRHYYWQDFLLSRMGFPFWLKSKEVKIGNEKMSWIIIKEKKLSERAVMKRMGSDECISREKNNTKRNLARVTTKSKSKMQTVSTDMSRWWVMNRGVESVQCQRPHQVSKIEA